jgi:hypothetical protein
VTSSCCFTAATAQVTGTLMFRDPLARAATLGQPGRLDEGREAVEELLALEPDNSERGHILIGHSVKDSDVSQKLPKESRKSA